jgi:predicted phage-related endonuclease
MPPADWLREQRFASQSPLFSVHRPLPKMMPPLELFEQETGIMFFPAVGVHESIEWMAASFDGVSIDRKAILEIKCPGKKDHKQALEGKIPRHYFPQIMHQIEVAGLDMSYYYSFDGESGVILEVKRDQAFIDMMLAKEKEFWDSIQISTMG